jgi:hypothetical protein
MPATKSPARLSGHVVNTRRHQQRERVADRPEQEVEGDRDGHVHGDDRQPGHQAAREQPPSDEDAVRRGLGIARHHQGVQHHR